MIDETFNVEKINSLSGCGNCIFCLTKCPECKTADVTIEYHRIYKKSGDIDSFALIACKCSSSILDTHIIPKEITGGEPQEFHVTRQDPYYEVPELTEYLDEYFENCNPLHPAEVHVIYEIENDTEDTITLQFENMIGNAEFKEDLPSIICFEITGKDENNHFDISVSMICNC